MTIDRPADYTRAIHVQPDHGVLSRPPAITVLLLERKVGSNVRPCAQAAASGTPPVSRETQDAAPEGDRSSP